MEATKTQHSMQVQQHSKGYLQTSKEVFIKEILAVYTPNLQEKVSLNIENCITGNYPTLAQLKNSYGDKAAIAWLIPQITDCVAFTNNKGVLNDRQVEALAALISSDYFYLRVSEIMLFFHKFKLGKYREIYGNFSPMAITLSLNEFIKERNAIYSRIELEKEWRKRKEEKKEAISYSEYIKSKNK